MRFQGILQSQAPLRRAAYLVHRSLIEKPVDIEAEWPLPFDIKTDDQASTFERLKKKLLEYKLKHGSPTA